MIQNNQHPQDSFATTCNKFSVVKDANDPGVGPLTTYKTAFYKKTKPSNLKKVNLLPKS